MKLKIERLTKESCTISFEYRNETQYIALNNIIDCEYVIFIYDEL